MKVLKLNKMKCSLDSLLFWPFCLHYLSPSSSPIHASSLRICFASLPLSLNNLVSKCFDICFGVLWPNDFWHSIMVLLLFLVALIYWKTQYLRLAKKSENVKGLTIAFLAKCSAHKTFNIELCAVRKLDEAYRAFLFFLEWPYTVSILKKVTFSLGISFIVFGSFNICESANVYN